MVASAVSWLAVGVVDASGSHFEPGSRLACGLAAWRVRYARYWARAEVGSMLSVTGVPSSTDGRTCGEEGRSVGRRP